MVAKDVRGVEAEIDKVVQQLPIWKCQKDLLLKALLEFWCDGLELSYTRSTHAATFQSSESVEIARAIEHQTSAGVFWCLKWAFEHAQESGGRSPSTEELVDTVITVGAPYQNLVDALKFASLGECQIQVDQLTRTITIFEGGSVSGYDRTIVSTDQTSLPSHQQTPLIDDSDQLTTAWTAGEYRRYRKWLKIAAEAAEEETMVFESSPLGAPQLAFKRPVVVQIDEPPAGLEGVQDDLTLTREKIDSGMKWKLSEWTDCPLVQVDRRTFGVSSVLKVSTGLDDYMLRVAVLNDRAQYDKATGLREDRMIGSCKAVLENAGWAFQSSLLLKNPAKEVDVLASKGGLDIVLQLKSTLRPHSPWEVYKRNQDLIKGIRHTAEVLPRFREGALGFVVTDGYEGDYSTRVESLRTHIPVASLRDIELIADDPTGAFDVVAKKAGIEGQPMFESLPDREIDLCGWTLRLVDTVRS